MQFLKTMFLDALASLYLKLLVSESVSNLPFYKYSVNQLLHVIQVIHAMHVIYVIHVIHLTHLRNRSDAFNTSGASNSSDTSNANNSNNKSNESIASNTRNASQPSKQNLGRPSTWPPTRFRGRTAPAPSCERPPPPPCWPERCTALRGGGQPEVILVHSFCIT